MSLRELKRAARNDLKGKWHIGIIVTIVAFIIGVYSFGLLPMINLPAEEWLKDPSVLLKDWRNIFYFDMRSVRMGLFYLLERLACWDSATAFCLWQIRSNAG